jgi:DNA-binding IclR family transcriptional regulator
VRSARSIANRALYELTVLTRESSYFGTLVDGDVLYLNWRAASCRLLSISRIGHRKRAYGTALAFLKEQKGKTLVLGEAPNAETAYTQMETELNLVFLNKVPVVWRLDGGLGGQLSPWRRVSLTP